MRSGRQGSGESRREAIERLFEAHSPAIYRLGLHTCHSGENAQDLVQETFIRAFDSWESFEGRSQERTWLYTIAVRACRRLERRRAGEPGSMAQWTDDGSTGHVGVPVEPDGPAPDPLQAVERGEAQRLVRSALASLPTGFRLPLLLKELEGMTVAEVAAILGLKPATVKTRLHRARMRLAEAILDPEAAAPLSTHEDSTCVDLIQARLEAGGRGVPFPLPAGVLCERCRSTFEALDLVGVACEALGRDRLEAAEVAALRRGVLHRIGGAASPPELEGPVPEP